MRLCRATLGFLLLLPVCAWGQGPGEVTTRQPWTTSRFQGTPEPPAPFITKRVFPNLNFKDPVDWAVEPGTGKIFVLELAGKLLCFDPRQPEPDVHLVDDLRARDPKHNHSYGLEFSPDYANNRTLYICYVYQPDIPDGSKVSRFRIANSNPPKLDPASEEVILTWPSGGHNGGCLKFGPDGFLYITTGDGTGPFPPDIAAVGQNLADLRSKILRIDISRREGDRPYAIPADNPFLSEPGARPETWSYGFRNPWKISFNHQTGELWCGDVGWELWEMVYRVERGGNYGWSVMEGRQPVRADIERGPTPILPPIAEHKHTEARSITGGYVYQGKALPELQGAYIYGDFVTGKIWALRNSGNTVISLQEIADTPLAIITFGLDALGELYVVDYAGGIYQLEDNPAVDRPSSFPRRLSEAGLFTDLESLTPAPGVTSYVLNAEMFQDGARAERVMAVPGTSSIGMTNNHDQWKFPEGTVAAKTLSAHVHHPVRGTAWQKIETQVMHYDGTEWRAYTYAWNEDASDAELVPAAGMERRLVLQDQSSWLTDSEGRRETVWRFHSRAECLTCHMPQPNVLLGFNPANLNRPTSTGDAEQIKMLVGMKLFDKEPAAQMLRRVMVDPHDSSADLETRARSYLAVNCASCHRRQGGGTAHIEFPIENALDKTHAIDTLPTQGTFNIPQARIVAPGDPNRSVLVYRLSTAGRGHMPHLGTRNIDERGVALIRDWVSSLPAASTESVVPPPVLREGPELETNLKEVLASTPQSLQLTTELAYGRASKPLQDRIANIALTEAEPHIRGLFERFLPESSRRPTLGTVIDPAQILAIQGDAARGRTLFLKGEGVSCRNCHQLEGEGRIVGPDLSKVLKQQTPEQILESILDPSRRIDRQFVTHSIATTDGRIVTGLLISESEGTVVIRDSAGKDTALSRSDIEESVPQPKSLMPDLLLRDLTADDVSHLLAYLKTFRD